MLAAQQPILVGTALLLSMVQWLLAGHASWISTLVYTLLAGNVVTLCVGAALPLFSRTGRRNWVRYLLFLFPVSLLASVVGGVVARLILRVPLHTLRNWRTGDLPYAALVSYTVGVVMFAFASKRLQMEAEKQALAQQVQRGERALETHAAELQAAFEIQSRLLPQRIPQVAGVEISCAWQPARTVSGDFFDVLELGEGRLGACLADVSGKGLSAALVTANLQAGFRAFAPVEGSAATVCERLNEALCASLPTGRFVTMAYAILDPRRMQMVYELAGHNPLLLLRRGEVLRLEGTGPVLGLLPGSRFADQVVRLEAGDRLLLTTDGVVEAGPPESEEEFGEERLVEAALRGYAGGVHGMRAEIMRAVGVFAEGHFADDASLMVVEVTRAGQAG